LSSEVSVCGHINVCDKKKQIQLVGKICMTDLDDIEI
jgi:hypothetical protein